eukprot:m.699479 g.699479  ORF g.699479 m.699479 type:complete len:74 (+) comp58692_c0_seq19:1092-1313(+)
MHRVWSYSQVLRLSWLSKHLRTREVIPADLPVIHVIRNPVDVFQSATLLGEFVVKFPIVVLSNWCGSSDDPFQ